MEGVRLFSPAAETIPLPLLRWRRQPLLCLNWGVCLKAGADGVLIE